MGILNTSVKPVMTTGEVAKACRVAPRTAHKWFDGGLIDGYRLPGSRDRRFHLADVVRFMTEHKFPLGDLAASVAYRVMLVAAGEQFEARLQAALGTDGVEYAAAHGTFHAAMQIVTFGPDAVVLGDVVREDAVAAARALRGDARTRRVFLAMSVAE